ncbi:MAG: ABC transporter ATP-binding protein [Chitinophagales bacterium]|nr:ABC transporter ATP-binding protein [Bacteroidota bacterium]MCB9042395.1 ABC transporter ATP-binding protein [Chitinophagales bacterium]
MNLYRTFWAYLKPYRFYALLNMLSNLFTVVFSLFSVLMVWPFLNLLFGTQDLVKNAPPLAFNKESISQNFNFFLSNIIATRGTEQALLFICALIIGMFFLKNLGRYMALFWLAPLRNGIVRDIRNKIYDKLLSLPIGYFTEQRKGDLLTRITADAQEVEWSMLSMIEIIFREPLMIILSLILMWIISPSLTLMVLLVLPISGWIIGSLGKVLKQASLQAQAQLSALLSIVEESIGGLRIIKAQHAETWMKAKMQTENDQHFAYQTNLFRRRDLSAPLSEFLGVCVFVAILYFGGLGVLNKSSSLDAAMFITFLGIFFQMITPAKSFATAWYNIQKGMASLNRINEILETPIRIKENDNAVAKTHLSDKVEFKNVNFTYNNERAVLQNINFTLPKGKTIALVGQSGSGKTTIADLLSRFYDIAEGEILIDDINLKNIRTADLRQLLGIVNQEAVLFNDTVFNNIAFGMDNASTEAVEKAARIANAHEFIEKLAQGYQTSVGERGSKLSGGQRQRITIARAILRNPQLLILDEATSALDSESEKLVQQSLTELMKNRTSLVIAHRLSTIQAADEILVMNNGKIVERGTHQELIDLQGEYSNLVKLQAF